MSVASHNTTTSLLATPEASTDSKMPEFHVVTRGYDRQQVEDHVRRLLLEIEHLGRQVASFAGKAAASPEGQKLVSDLAQIMMDEITGQKAAAEQEVQQMLSGAREQADGILADARQQADQSSASATAQAASLINDARAEAKRTVDDATAHAAAVHEAAGARLAKFAQLYEDTRARLQQMHEVTGERLAAEVQRGPLSDEVARALAPASSQQYSARLR